MVFIDNDAKSLVSCAVDEDKGIIDGYSNAKGCIELYKDPEASDVVEEHSTMADRIAKGLKHYCLFFRYCYCYY